MRPSHVTKTGRIILTIVAVLVLAFIIFYCQPQYLAAESLL